MGDAALPGADDLIDRLEGFVDDLEVRLAAAELRAEEGARRAQTAEARLAEALAEIERLKRERQRELTVDVDRSGAAMPASGATAKASRPRERAP